MKQLIKGLPILIIVAVFSACMQKSNHNTENAEQTMENKEMDNEELARIDEAIKQYIACDKFAETPDYPGIGDEELRKPMNEVLNTLAVTFQKIAHQCADEKLYQTAIRQVLENMDDIYLDSEDQDQLCASIETLMDIVGLENSGEALSQWRYGFSF